MVATLDASRSSAAGMAQVACRAQEVSAQRLSELSSRFSGRDAPAPEDIADADALAGDPCLRVERCSQLIQDALTGCEAYVAASASAAERIGHAMISDVEEDNGVLATTVAAGQSLQDTTTAFVEGVGQHCVETLSVGMQATVDASEEARDFAASSREAAAATSSQRIARWTELARFHDESLNVLEKSAYKLVSETHLVTTTKRVESETAQRKASHLLECVHDSVATIEGNLEYALREYAGNVARCEIPADDSPLPDVPVIEAKAVLDALEFRRLSSGGA